MFFIFAITQGRRQLPFRQTADCPCCGRLGGISIWVTYTCLTIFFIPVCKWNKRYYAVMSCCGAVTELDEATGSLIERGKSDRIDLSRVHFCKHESASRRCPSCGFMTDENFEFCPHCGHPLER